MQITDAMVKAKLKPRDAYAHKGDFGKLCLVCGSRAYSGAAALSSRAAARMGAGLVRLCSTRLVIDRMQTPEVVYTELPAAEDGAIARAAVSTLRAQAADAWVIGCGLSLGFDTISLVQQLITALDKPLVLDADALNAVARDCQVLHYKRAPIVLTPHMGEMARLTRKPVEEIFASREQTALAFAKEYGVTVVLKGHDTVIAAETGELYINPTGNAGMARGGSGDVLAGMLGALLAQGLSPMDAACCAVYLHGLAGDLCKEHYTELCMLPTDLIEQLPAAVKRVTEA